MNNSTKIITGIIALIATLSIGFGIGYMYCENIKEKKPIEEENNQKQDEDLKEKNLSYDDEKVQSVIKMVGALDKIKGFTPTGNVSNYFGTNKNVNIKDMDAKWKNTFVYIIYSEELKEENNNKYPNIDGTVIIEEDKFKEYYAKCFDIKSYEPANFYWFDNFEFNYDKSNKIYYTNQGVGDNTGPSARPITIYNYAKEIGNKLEIYTYYYIELDGTIVDLPQIIYSDYEEKNKIYESTIAITKDEILANYKDKLEQQKYTFEKSSNGNYVFTKFEKIN